MACKLTGKQYTAQCPCGSCEERRERWREKNRRWRKANPEKHRERFRRWRKANPEKHRERMRRWAEANPDKDRERGWRQQGIKMTFALYEELVTMQRGACGVCGVVPDTLRVDHCHDTGWIRGLLCDACNRGLGCLGDTTTSLKRALTYLQKSDRRRKAYEKKHGGLQLELSIPANDNKPEGEE